MTRAQQQLSLGLLVASIYTICILGLLPFPETIQNDIVPVLPFWTLIAFGAYLLGKLGYGVLTFNDVPEAHAELMGQIAQAREELRAIGVTVD